MSIATAIQNAQQKVSDAYTAISNKGGTLPATQNLSNMPTAINSISTGGTISSLNVTPSTSVQTITASGGVDGYSPVNVSAVTSSIDANIQAGNIKKDVSILGVTGTYEGSGGGTDYPIGNYFIMNDGSIQPLYFGTCQIGSSHYTKICLLPDFTTMDGTETGKIYTYPSYTPVDLSSIRLNRITNVDYNNYYDIEINKVKHINLTAITGYINFAGVFTSSVGFTSLKSVNCSNATKCYLIRGFIGTPLESIDFSSLTDLTESGALGGTAATGGAFANCTSLQDLSFPALTSTSFGSRTNQFNYMLNGVTGCKVHFPSNLQSVIGSWSSVSSGFGGTNTTVLWDLPATT